LASQPRADLLTVANTGSETVECLFNGDPRMCLTAIAAVDAAGGNLVADLDPRPRKDDKMRTALPNQCGSQESHETGRVGLISRRNRICGLGECDGPSGGDHRWDGNFDVRAEGTAAAIGAGSVMSGVSRVTSLHVENGTLRLGTYLY
jgi:hypothetical protein